MNYIFITGGVCSGIGKGLLAASIGRLLQKQGFKIHVIKFDPYFLESPDNLNPNEHGEAFVLDDGTVCDLDLGHYKRFIPELEADYRSSQTSGKIYKKVIEDSAQGKHQGKTTQLVPHVSNEIIERFQAFETPNSEMEFTLIEIGGTVGDMESDIYLESIKQFKRMNKKSILIHLGLLPYIEQSGELKTKALQHSVSELQSRGVSPDVLVCRNKYGITEDERKKLAMFCNVDENCIIDDKDGSVYDLCGYLNNQQIIETLYRKLSIGKKIENINYKIEFPIYGNAEIVITYKKVAIIGKYFKNIDAYKSILESLKLQQLITGIPVETSIINSECLNEDTVNEVLKGYDAIIVPGGFGVRGTEGKMVALHYARLNKIPCLGICLGFQLMCLELIKANDIEGYHEELEPGKQNRDKYVIKLQDNQAGKELSANTMRLGKYKFNINPDSKLYNIYQTNELERICRYRYEFNNDFKGTLEMLGMKFGAKWDNENVITSCELEDHPFYIGVQYHPELSSTLEHPEQLFVELIRSTVKKEGI